MNIEVKPRIKLTMAPVCVLVVFPPSLVNRFFNDLTFVVNRLTLFLTQERSCPNFFCRDFLSVMSEV